MKFSTIVNINKQLILDPIYWFTILSRYGFYNKMSDEDYIKKSYRLNMGKELDLENPQTFNEKLQWLKIHDRNPEYTKMVDKYEVKKYVADIIGEEYIIPTLGVWDRFEDIDFSRLPDQFVLKCTHDSGGIVICKDKNKLDVQAEKRKINKSLKRNFFYIGREWPYNDVKPRIIVEPYIEESDSHELTDIKIHCFNGIPKIILVCQDRFSEEGLAEDFFDIDWNHLDVQRPGQRHCSHPIECPASLSQMIDISKIVSQEFPFLRVDFYYVNGKIYIGELTLYPASGFKPFEPEEWDYKLGEWIKLPVAGKTI